MTIKIVTCFCLLSLSLKLYAQTNNNAHNFKLEGIAIEYSNFAYFLYGSNSEQEIENFIGDKSNYTLTDSNQFVYFISGYPTSSFSIQSNFKNTKQSRYKAGGEFSLGIAYNKGSRFRAYSEKRTGSYGEIVYNHNNELIIKDSINVLYSRFEDLYRDLSLNSSYLYCPNPGSRLKLNIGVGLSVGHSMSSIISNFSENYIYHKYYYYLNNEFISESDSIISYKTSETNYKLKGSFVIQPILKYGINYQLSLKDNFLNRFSLSMHGYYGAEFRFSNSFDKLSTYSRGISFGLKYSFLPIQSSKPIKPDKENVNTKLTLKPILGFKLFDDYNGQYAIIKGVIYSVPVFGVELFNNRNNISFELRRHVFLKTFGEDTIASFSMVNSTTILSVNYKIKDGFYKNCRFGIGLSYFNFKDMNSSTLSPYYANSLGFSSFFSFPLKWIDIEIRNETIVWPDIHLFETHNWSINLVYRFGK